MTFADIHKPPHTTKRSVLFSMGPHAVILRQQRFQHLQRSPAKLRQLSGLVLLWMRWAAGVRTAVRVTTEEESTATNESTDIKTPLDSTAENVNHGISLVSAGGLRDKQHSLS